ncbi:hypothetical protein [Mesorhizobium sp. KR2-14]|uniref:hypothetical protein n=1 Tax=Mesorhizobium sp. KR2-14 TaxID=3156610 RepID=UPI0032B5189C
MGKTVAIPNSDMFTEIEGAKALISARGVYMQTGLYRRDDKLFVAYGRGFARLLLNNNTTVSNVRWEAIEGVSIAEHYNGPSIAEKPSLKVA